MGNLGAAYCLTGQGEKAATILKEFIAGHRKRSPANNSGLAGLQAQVGLDLLKCRQYPVAEEVLRECLAIREKTQPDVWTTFNTQSMLGGALLGQQKYADAEPLLLAGYDGMNKQEAKIPPQGKARLTEAVERLVQLYHASGNQDEAAKWRKTLEMRKQAGAVPQEAFHNNGINDRLGRSIDPCGPRSCEHVSFFTIQPA